MAGDSVNSGSFSSPASLAAAEVHQVDIDESGFDPADLTIEVGNSVQWNNLTGAAVTLAEGELSHIFLPAVFKTSPNGSLHHLPAASENAPDDNQILPAGSYTRLFTEVGSYHFYLKEQPYANSVVHVLPLDPDVEVRSITLNPHPANVNTPVNLSTEIYNIGGGDAGAFTVEMRLYHLGGTTAQQSGSWNVTGISAGGNITLNTNLTHTIPGPFTVEVSADPSAALEDADLSNNIDEVEFGVRSRLDFCGNISADTTWAYATYVLTCAMDIQTGEKLILRDGAVVKPQAGLGIQVHGSLETIGADPEFVAFTSFKDDSYGGDSNGDGNASAPVPGDWSGIYIHPAGQVHFKQDTHLRFATTLIQNQGGTFKIHQSVMGNNSGSAVYSTSNGVIDITGCQVEYNGGYGVYYSASGQVSPRIRDTTFRSNSLYAIYFAPSGDLELDGTEMVNNTAISNGTNGLRLMGSWVGLSTLGALSAFRMCWKTAPATTTARSLSRWVGRAGRSAASGCAHCRRHRIQQPVRLPRKNLPDPVLSTQRRFPV